MSQKKEESLSLLLGTLRLKAMARSYEDLARQGEKNGWSFESYLRELVELEIGDRENRRIERLLRESKLPPGKTLETFKLDRLPVSIQRLIPTLCEGHFLDRAENIMAFGLPGRGKTHLLCALGHELVRRGRRVLFTPTYRLVQLLLAAKKDLRLEKEVKRLDRYEAVVIDDLGYVQHSREEMEVLFTFLSERYERRSVMLTSNLVFSQWEKIFKDPMTTAAAIDRLVHHGTILELTGPSLRGEGAQSRSEADPDK